MRTVSVAFISAAALVAFAGCGGGASTAAISAVTSLTGDSSSGQPLFAQNCEQCHGANATSGMANRPLPTMAQSNESNVVSTILAGQDEMPSFSSTLTDQQIADVVAYLKTLSPRAGLHQT